MKRFSMKYWAWALAGLTFLLGFLAVVLTAQQSAALSAELWNLANDGVAHNRDWRPIRRRIGWHAMVLVPSGCFQMGSTEAELEAAQQSCSEYYGAFGCQADFTDEQPAREICLKEPFWLGLTEVTNWQFALSAGLGSLSYEYSNLNWPRSAVTWQQASDYCQAMGGRLPTEAEWEFAARGPDSLIFPFGNDFELDKASLRKISPVAAGKKPEGASWVGALDMSGSMAEWVADRYAVDRVVGVPSESESASPPLRVVKGGSWFAHADYLVRAAEREPMPASTANSTIGFRCILEVPE